MTRFALAPVVAGSLALASLADTPIAGTDMRAERAPSVTCSTSSTEILLGSTQVARTIGLDYAVVATEPLNRVVLRNAEVSYNANRFARLSSRAPGIVIEVYKDLGDPVQAGEVIAIVDSVELGSAKADLLQAREIMTLWETNAAREQVLFERGAGTERDLLESRTRLGESRIGLSRAEQRLRILGLNTEQIAEVVSTNDTSSLLPITAPFSALLVDRNAVMGEVVDTATTLFSVADTSTMWTMIDLNESDLGVVRKGQPVLLTVDGMRREPFAGRLTWISTALDHETRTLRARAEFENPDGMLLANMFGRASILAGESRDAVTIDKAAVQWEGCCNIAFVKANEEGTHFRPVRLRLGFDAGDRYEVISGLRGGEVIVTRGAFVLKNELLKDAVGAGCCEVEHLAK